MQNCFNSIRHFAAFLVLFSHHYALTGRGEPTIPLWDTLGFLAVAIFFAISGYLMPHSFQSSDNFLHFMEKRVRRIFPGLIFCAFVMVYVIGTIFTPSGIVEYLTSPSNAKTFVLLSMFDGRPIPGVFSDFVYPNALNGSLWTLPVEFACYLIIGVGLAFCRSWKTAAVLLMLACAATATTNIKWDNFSFYNVPLGFLALFGISFCTGALLSLTATAWRPYRLHLAILAAVIIYVIRGRYEIQVLGTASIAILTVVIGTTFKERLLKAGTDISYGVYIYAFPIQQIVINRITDHFWGSMIISAVLVSIAGYLSYRYVESPFLKRRKQTMIESSAADPATSH